MNTKNLKAYAPKARKQFIEAIKKRAAHFGIYEDRVEDVRIEGGAAIIEGRAFTRKEGEQRKRLEKKVTERASATYQEKYDMFIREMAYTWFNRLAAIRYMEIHDYLEHGFRVLSNPNNAEGLPEILNHASDVADTLELDKSHIIELQLAGDKEEELYRELLLGQCHQLAKILPQIFKGLAFDAIDDATELLLPNNLTKTDSILKGLINDIPEEDWQEIEVIGWLYQFYISEHKDSVMGKVVKSEDIPAATQLFTPNWIVKYLVQNSLGRHWLATYPESELKGKMEYYIEPAEQSDDVIEQLKAITPTSIDPEEIKIIDPAVGSGHILVEVYEVLREIYLERGYRLREIPELILTKNIYGLDIDNRAAQLAGFALMMKAREDDRRIFQRVQDGEVTLNIYSLQSTESIDIPSLWRALDLEGNQQQGSTGGLFDMSEGSKEPSGIHKEYYKLLQTLKIAFLQAKTLGSLIQIENEHLANLAALKELLQVKEQGSDPAAKQAAIELLPIINQAIILAKRYISTIMNPPYLGSKGMNTELKDFAKKQFPNSKSDLFSLFMERAFALLTANGYNAQVNMQSWMFLSSYESLREWLLDTKTFVTMAHLGARAFGQISGEVVQTTAWVLNNSQTDAYQPIFFRLINGNEDEKCSALKNRENSFDQTKQKDFKKIPGSPIAYWVDNLFRQTFVEHKSLSTISTPKQGLATGDNGQFTRLWYELNINDITFDTSSFEDSKTDDITWVPYSKGGGQRRWFGFDDTVVYWKNGGDKIRNFKDDKGNERSRFRGFDYYFLPAATWGLIASGSFSVRYRGVGAVFDIGGMSAFTDNSREENLVAYLNSKFVREALKVINPTLNYQAGDIAKLPFNKSILEDIELYKYAKEIIDISKKDWFQSEVSKDFNSKIMTPCLDAGMISTTYQNYCEGSEYNKLKYIELSKNIEEKIQKHLNLPITKLDFDAKDIHLNSNPYFKYSTSDENCLNIFRSDYIANMVSLTIGHMMGRYSLDRDGLVYANFDNTVFKELVADDAYQKFSADDDGIVPLASEEWLFDDDATTRFKEFVKTVWGNEYLNENLEFIAESLCLHALKPMKGESANDTVRRYFSKQFYKDHCKTYKKRPIYWLFSSGKEKAFECLVYLHRYNEGTLSRMRTEYVTPLMGKYEAQHTLLSEQQLQATGTEARSIEKDLKSLEKKQAELRTFDEQLKHYTEKRITLDLDDGVKANYGKFGNLLADVKAIHGKAVK